MSKGRFEQLATGYGLVEGPRVDADDNLYFSDARKGGVYRRAPDGEIDVVIPKRRGVGGIALHAEGGIVVSGRNLCHVRDGQSRVVFDVPDAPGFNDLFTDSKGRVLVGSQRFDPFAPGATPIPGELYRIESQEHAEKLYDDIALTNGIGFSPDGGRLYHCDSARSQILVHDVVSDRCENRRIFVTLEHGAPDGMAVDEAGCVWVAAYGAGLVLRFTPQGELDLALEVPSTQVASLCFGGADRRDLYVATADKGHVDATGGGIHRTRVEVPGLAVPLATV